MCNFDNIEIFVRKKAGNLEPWNPDKILKAVGKSAERVMTALSDQEEACLIAFM